MSIRCQSWVYEYSDTTGNDRLVLLAIADEADDDGANATPGIIRIAKKARINQRTTMRCIDRLEKGGHLVVNRPAIRGRGHYNTYRVVMGKGDTLSPDAGSPSQDPRPPKDDTVSPDPDPEKGDKNPRKSAQPYLDRHRPIDPENPKVKGVAASKPQTPARALAQRIVTTWWDEVVAAGGPRPLEKFIAVVKLIEQFLEAGWEEEAVADALRLVPCITINSLSLELRRRQRPQESVGTDNVASAVAWIEAPSGE